MNVITGTAIEDAIKAGRKGNSCEITFPNCKLTQKNLENFSSNISKFSKTNQKHNTVD